MKWPEELIPKSGSPFRLSCKPLKGKVALGDNRIHVGAKAGFSCAMLTDVPRDVRITLRAKPQPGTLNFGLCCRGAGDYEKGCEVRFEPARRRIQFGRPRHGESVKDWNDGWQMANVPGLDREFTIDLILKDDLIDVCVGNRRTLIGRPAADGDRLFFFVRDGGVAFEEIAVRSLLREPAPK